MSSSSPPPTTSPNENPTPLLPTADAPAEKDYSFTPAGALPQYHEAVRNADVFWKLIHEFHESRGTNIKIPKVDGKPLDLHVLFVEVTSRGGFEKVVSGRRWKEVIAAFNFRPSITSASYVIRKYYVSLLYMFEQVYYFGEQLPLPLPPTSEPVHPDIPAPQPGSSVTGVIDGKFDSGYLVSVKVGDEVLKGVLYHFPQAPQISETVDASAPSRRRKRPQKSTRDSSPRSKTSRKSHSLSFSEEYARVQPVCSEQEEKVTTNIKPLRGSELTGSDKPELTVSDKPELTGADKQAQTEQRHNGS